MLQLPADLRYAIRTLQKNPGLTAIAVLSLGLGIGATTSTFSVINALNFRQLPYADPSRLVWLTEVGPPTQRGCAGSACRTSLPTANDWFALARSYAATGGQSSSFFAWEHDDVREDLDDATATPGFFKLLGVRPLLGREFIPSDTMAGANPVVLLTYDFWQGRLGGLPSVLGTRLIASYGTPRSGPRPVTVIGVLPKTFRLENQRSVWMPLGNDPTPSRSRRWVAAIGRLKPGVTVAAADAELKTISAQLATTYPEEYRGWGAEVDRLRNLFVSPRTGKGRFALFGVTTLVLFIAVLNVGGLLLGRAAARQQEFALRTALGASRLRLLAQRLVEGSCIGLAGAVIGIVVAFWAVRFMAGRFSIEPTGLVPSVDHRMLAFAAAVALLAGVGAAAIPAVGAGRPDLNSSLRGRAATTHGIRGRLTSNLLITLQIALGFVLLTGAGLLSRDFLEVRYLDLGYDPHNLYQVSVSGTAEQSAHPLSWRVVAEEVRAAVMGVPGVVSASFRYYNGQNPSIVHPAGSSAAQFSGDLRPEIYAVDADFFSTVTNRIILGRPFTSADRAGAPAVAILNATAAKMLWPGQDVLGHEVFVGDSGSVGELLTVVGVAVDMADGAFATRHPPFVYRPFEQARLYHTAAKLYVRVLPKRSGALSGSLAAIHEVTNRPSSPFQSAEQAIGDRLLPQRFNAIALDLFASFGLVLAAMGLYGTIAYAVTRRTREIGIRVALGAEQGNAIFLIARGGIVVTMIGVTLGVVGGFAVTHVLRSFMSGTSVANPALFVAASVVMITVAIVATFLPARRAARVDPITALRAE